MSYLVGGLLKAWDQGRDAENKQQKELEERAYKEAQLQEQRKYNEGLLAAQREREDTRYADQQAMEKKKFAAEEKHREFQRQEAREKRLAEVDKITGTIIDGETQNVYNLHANGKTSLLTKDTLSEDYNNYGTNEEAFNAPMDNPAGVEQSIIQTPVKADKKPNYDLAKFEQEQLSKRINSITERRGQLIDDLGNITDKNEYDALTQELNRLQNIDSNTTQQKKELSPEAKLIMEKLSGNQNKQTTETPQPSEPLIERKSGLNQRSQAQMESRLNEAMLYDPVALKETRNGRSKAVKGKAETERVLEVLRKSLGSGIYSDEDIQKQIDKIISISGLK